MKIVIDIDEDVYKRFMNNENKERHQLTEKERFELSTDAVRLTRAFCNGTPLPKGHGDLKDADEIKEFYRKKLVSNLIDETRGLDWSEYAELPCKVFNEVINDAPTIIEADNAESEDKK